MENFGYDLAVPMVQINPNTPPISTKNRSKC